MNIEPLEARIAPAILLDPTHVRYTDVDGDVVLVSISKGTFDLVSNFTFIRDGFGEQLQRLSLGTDGGEFAGAKLTITATRAASGDGLANIGHLDAAGIDLGVVRISGDLGRIEAGDADFSSAGVDSLEVGSLGKLGVATQAVDDAGLASEIRGDLVTLRITRGMRAASLFVAGGQDGVGGAIGSIGIGGSLRGDAADESGLIHSTGDIGRVRVGGEIIGGDGRESGGILAEGSLGSLNVAGSIKSGSGLDSGSIRAGGRIDSIEIGGAIVGTSVNPVSVRAGGLAPSCACGDASALGLVRVDHSVKFANILAGYDPAAAAVNSDARIGRIIVGGNWMASSAVAGAVAGPDGLFGTADDAGHFPNLSTVIAGITSISIAGKAKGTVDQVNDHFGFVAEEIGSVTVEGKTARLLPGPNNDADPAAARLALGTSGDLRIFEVSSQPPPPTLLAAVSRKIHGAAGAFDIDLPLSGTPGVESRTGTSMTLVFTFDHNINGGTASIASGTGIVGGVPTFDGPELTLSLNAVADIQTIVIRLSDISDTNGGMLSGVDVSVAILLGDVNGSRAVNTSDVNLVRAATATGVIDATNFRTDVDVNGAIDNADVSVTSSNSGNVLNPP